MNLLNLKQDILGNRVRDKILFTAESIEKPTLAQIKEWQTNSGYDPRGYGGPDNVKISYDSILFRYKTTWNCSASCD